MGRKQAEFLALFRAAFIERIASDDNWAGGQVAANTAQLTPVAALRRGGTFRAGELFEIGDLRCDLPAHTVIVEYESDYIAVHNLLKYWPYLRGDLTKKPTRPILLCHFSNWASYGSHRDLWEWLYQRMKSDSGLIVSFDAKQFDHWQTEVERASASITTALDWIEIATSGRD